MSPRISKYLKIAVCLIVLGGSSKLQNDIDLTSKMYITFKDNKRINVCQNKF